MGEPTTRAGRDLFRRWWGGELDGDMPSAMESAIRAVEAEAHSAPLDVDRLRRALASDQEMFRLLWPDENGLDLAAERIGAEYVRLIVDEEKP